MAKHWLIGAIVSVFVHGAIAAAFLVSVRPAITGARTEPMPALQVDLFRPGDIAAGRPPRSSAILPTSSAEAKAPAAVVAAPSQGTLSPEAGLSGSGGAPASASPNSEAVSDYYRKLETHLARFHTYPALVGRRPEGLARVGLIVNRDGRVMDAWIETSSGSRQLDDAAMATVRRSEPLPSLPGDLPSSIDLIVPLKFDVGLRASS